jgi:hypothetical protein
MKNTILKPEEQALILSEWKVALTKLELQIQDWLRPGDGWSIKSLPIEITEEELGTYTVNKLVISCSKGVLHLEPIARIVFGGRGSVELYAWPTLFRVRLLISSKSDEWEVLTDSGIKLKQMWNRENFIDLANSLLDAQ